MQWDRLGEQSETRVGRRRKFASKGNQNPKSLGETISGLQLRNSFLLMDLNQSFVLSIVPIRSVLPQPQPVKPPGRRQSANPLFQRDHKKKKPFIVQWFCSNPLQLYKIYSLETRIFGTNRTQVIMHCTVLCCLKSLSSVPVHQLVIYCKYCILPYSRQAIFYPSKIFVFF